MVIETIKQWDHCSVTIIFPCVWRVVVEETVSKTQAAAWKRSWFSWFCHHSVVKSLTGWRSPSQHALNQKHLERGRNTGQGAGLFQGEHTDTQLQSVFERMVSTIIIINVFDCHCCNCWIICSVTVCQTTDSLHNSRNSKHSLHFNVTSQACFFFHNISFFSVKRKPWRRDV